MASSSARLTPLPVVGKTSSCENISSKSKEDRSRSKDHSKFTSKQQQQVSSNNSYTNSRGTFRKNNYGNCHRQNHSNYMAQSKANYSGRRNQVTQRRRDDFSSVPVDKKGIKKVNLNHLLNFTFDNDHSSLHRGGSNYHPTAHRYYNTKSTASCFNKEQFIQANCQLIMKSGNDYDVYRADTDLPMEWGNVEKINMWSEEIPSCPICLYPSSVSRVTKCGHIFCWPCILHYLALDDKTWRKCPICHEAVHKTDLKSVTVYQDEVYKNQSFITMKLMKRKKDTVQYWSAMQDVEQQGHHDTTDLSKVERNHRFLVASSTAILHQVVHQEMEILQCKLAIEDDEMEKGFIMEAIKLCKEREETLLEEQQKKVDQPQDAGMMSNNETANNNNNVTLENVEQQTAASDASTAESAYYFYQASGGQHIYLHPLNMKCLLHQYGSYDRCPVEITARITDVEHFSMSEVIRKRHRYMSHLPLSLEFRIAELDFRTPLISTETLAIFQDAFDKRSRERKKKSRNEKRLLRKLNAEEMKKQGKYPSAHIRLNSEHQFPDIHCTKPASFSVLQPVTAQVESNSEGSSVVGSLENQYNGPSFAQMMKTRESSSSTSYVPRRVTTTATSDTSGVKLDDDDDPNYVPPPTYQSSFGDALTTALQQLGSKDEGGSSSSNGNAVGGGGRKKKKGGRKKVLLFSTAGQQHQ